VLKFFITAGASFVPLGANRTLLSLYPPITWAGPLLLGYVFGRLYKTGANAKQRRADIVTYRFLIHGAVSPVAVNKPLRQPGTMVPLSAIFPIPLLAFLNTAKQPPSLLFLLMTLGPGDGTIGSLPKTSIIELTAFFEVYGNVPYFYFHRRIFSCSGSSILY
jgi:uncharacterized membrane protein